MLGICRTNAGAVFKHGGFRKEIAFLADKHPHSEQFSAEIIISENLDNQISIGIQLQLRSPSIISKLIGFLLSFGEGGAGASGIHFLEKSASSS